MQANFLKSSAALILLATLIGSFCAQAEDAGWYLGASIGRSSVDEDLDGATLDDDATAFRLYGGFDFNEYFGVEAQYIDFGTIEESASIGALTVNVDADANGFGLAGVGRLPLSEKFSLSGKLGFHAWDVDLTTNGIDDSDSDQDLYLGAGAEFRFADTWRVVGEVERYTLDDVDVLVFSLGARVRF